EDAIEREEDDQKKELGVVARHVQRVFYKLDGKGYLPQERWHIWTIDSESGEATQLTDGDVHDELDPRWSPDGEEIVFHSNHADDPDLDPDADDLFIMPADGGEPRKWAFTRTRARRAATCSPWARPGASMSSGWRQRRENVGMDCGKARLASQGLRIPIPPYPPWRARCPGGHPFMLFRRPLAETGAGC
ncbi:MAG: hypothetical protein R6T96_03045, partial [Longimicrobiales bacterium]